MSVDALAELFRGRRVCALTGAGVSTESGIPDYRGPETRRRARNPIQGKAFRESEALRLRYWARAAIGWSRFGAAAPNAGHRALAELERLGVVVGVITQNVDGLHQAAGSQRVVELHGALREVHCLDCGVDEARESVQERLLAANPGWLARGAEIAPDGDADLPEEAVAGFTPPGCLRCDGPLKPSVVFFGETVPKPVVDDAFALLESSEALLVAGTSLAVFSGFRFVRAAVARGMPIGLLNLGETRGAEHAHVRVEAPSGEALPELLARLEGVR